MAKLGGVFAQPEGLSVVIAPHPVCGRGTKPRGRLRVGSSPITDAEPLAFCCEPTTFVRSRTEFLSAVTDPTVTTPSIDHEQRRQDTLGRCVASRLQEKTQAISRTCGLIVTG
jgi:hypothetical protein